MAEKKVVRPKKPRVLVVGGEPRNLQSKRLHQLFELTHIDRTYRSIPALRDKEFDAVALLPWKDPSMTAITKKWAAGRKLPCVDVRSVGQIGYYLAKNVAWIKDYLKEAEKPASKKETRKEVKEEAPVKPAELDEDSIWEACGEPFAQKLRGLDKEVTDRATFVSLVKDETGLEGESIEVIIKILNRQGVITEQDGMVAIGEVTAVDIEKKRRHIAKTIANRETPGGIRGEIRDAVFEEEEKKEEPVPAFQPGPGDVYASKAKPPGKDKITDEILLGFFKTIAGDRVFKNQLALFSELFRLGLKKKGGRPYSIGGMRNHLDRARELGVVVQDIGKGTNFRILYPGMQMPIPAPPLETHTVSSLVEAAVAEMAKPEPVPTDPPPATAAAVAVPVLKTEPSPPATLKDFLGKPGKVYDSVEASYPGKKIPDLAGLDDVARTIRGVFWDPAWDKAAARTILTRLRLPIVEENLTLILQSKLDFTDEEWANFALEYLRDQPLGSLYLMFSREEGTYRKCTECQDDFFYKFPKLCRDCFGKRKQFFQDAKGGDV